MYNLTVQNFAIFVNVIYASAIQLTMVKSNAEKQHDYRPWHDMQVIACAHNVTHANQEKGGIGRR